MDIETLQRICKALPHATEDIKWGDDLCFCIAEKIFCVVGLNQSPTTASFKVSEEEFDTISNREGIKPAPYTARYKWVLVDNLSRMSEKEWLFYTEQSYNLVKNKLSTKLKKELGLT